MKKLLLACLLMSGMVSFSTQSICLFDCANIYAQSGERIATGVYMSGGRSSIIMLRIVGGNIMDIAYGRDALGRWNWKSIYPTSYRRTNMGMDGRTAQDYMYVASINGTTVYFN